MTFNLFAVASGKGGVGKTFLSIALAQSFARRGERTLLVDGDLGLANIDVQLGVQTNGDLLSVMAGALTIENAVAAFDGGANAGGFDILAGRSGNGALRTLPQREILMLGQSLKLIGATYDRAIVDLGAGVDTAVIDLAGFCDRVLIVLTDEPTSLTDAYAFAKVLSQRPRPPAMAVAVNMVSGEDEARRSFAALERACLKFLGFAPRYAGSIQRDPRVRDAIRAQTPYLTRSPNGPAAKDIERLASELERAFDGQAEARRVAGAKLK